MVVNRRSHSKKTWKITLAKEVKGSWGNRKAKLIVVKRNQEYIEHKTRDRVKFETVWLDSNRRDATASMRRLFL